MKYENSSLEYVLNIMKIHNYSVPLRKMKTQLTYPKNRFSQFLLAVSLFFTVFSFLGYAGNSKSQQSQTTKTEFSHNFKTGKKIISYKKGIAITSQYSSLNKTREYEKQALSVYNKLTKIKFDANSLHRYSFKLAARFFQLKTIPQNSTTEFSSATV